jgi:hypothetical protein
MLVSLHGCSHRPGRCERSAWSERAAFLSPIERRVFEAGWAGHGAAGRGLARLGEARQGLVGEAGLGMAWRGSARQGEAGQGFNTTGFITERTYEHPNRSYRYITIVDAQSTDGR